MSAKKEYKSKSTTKKKASSSAKKRTTPSKNSSKRPTTKDFIKTVKTYMNTINLRGEKYYKEPRFDKTIPITKVIKELNICIEDIFREGVDSNIAFGTKVGGDKHVFFLYEDIRTFLANPDIPLSSKDIRWAFKEIHVSGKGYKIVDVMPHMDLPSYDISINTLCITEEGFDYLKEKFMVNSVDRKSENKKNRMPRIPDNKFKQLCKEVEKEFPKKLVGGKSFFSEVSKNSKTHKYDPTGCGYTPQTTKKRYYEVFSSKKTNH
jgi:hypothetical protein